jgi:hypothetical protein
VFSNGDRMTLTPALGLKLESTSKESVTFESSDPATVSVPFMAVSGVGPMIAATWDAVGVPESCNGVPASSVSAGVGMISVSLPTPTGASVSVAGFDSDQQPLMAVVPGSAAEMAGLPSSGTVQVLLSYQDRDVDMTSDPRTIFDLTEANGLFEIDPDTKSIRALVGAGVGVGNNHCAIPTRESRGCNHGAAGWTTTSWSVRHRRFQASTVLPASTLGSCPSLVDQLRQSTKKQPIILTCG